MEEFYIYETNGNLKENIKLLKENGYKYVVKACDKFLSGWGGAENKKHIQIIACKNSYELGKIKNDLYNDKTFNYIDFNYIDNYKAIYNWCRNKSFTVRNNWYKAFN